MNPLARLGLALLVGGLIVSCNPTSVVGWVFGFAGFLVVMGAGTRRRRW